MELIYVCSRQQVGTTEGIFTNLLGQSLRQRLGEVFCKERTRLIVRPAGATCASARGLDHGGRGLDGY